MHESREERLRREDQEYERGLIERRAEEAEDLARRRDVYNTSLRHERDEMLSEHADVVSSLEDDVRDADAARHTAVADRVAAERELAVMHRRYAGLVRRLNEIASGWTGHTAVSIIRELSDLAAWVDLATYDDVDQVDGEPILPARGRGLRAGQVTFSVAEGDVLLRIEDTERDDFWCEVRLTPTRLLRLIARIHGVSIPATPANPASDGANSRAINDAP